MRRGARGNDGREETPVSGHFHPGDMVRVRNDWPESGPNRVHIRTPHFLRGQLGTIERRLGEFPNPEDLAFSRPADPSVLYQVKFQQRVLFPDGKGNPADTLAADIYEHWLEPANG